MLSKNNDSIIGTLLYLVSPNKRHWPSSIIITDDLNSIFMRLLNLIIKQLWLIVLNFNTDSTNLNLILYDVSINIKCCYDSWASTESNLVTLNLWSWCFTLDIDTCCLTWHYDILRDDNVVFWLLINHDGTWIKMCKRTFMDCCITLQWQNTSGIWSSSLIVFVILKCITLEVAMENFYTCVWHCYDTRNFSMCFFCATIQW